MLVLTRAAPEEIQIGNGVLIKVLSIKGGHVKIGIAAPDDVLIRRAEVWLPELAEHQERTLELAEL
jgi:carbon storage regulator